MPNVWMGLTMAITSGAVRVRVRIRIRIKVSVSVSVSVWVAFCFVSKGNAGCSDVLQTTGKEHREISCCFLKVVDGATTSSSQLPGMKLLMIAGTCVLSALNLTLTLTPVYKCPQYVHFSGKSKGKDEDYKTTNDKDKASNKIQHDTRHRTQYKKTQTRHDTTRQKDQDHRLRDKTRHGGRTSFDVLHFSNKDSL
jgi:hypothetical protein